MIIYNLEQYQLNGVRPFDASKQLSYWEQAHGQKKSQFKIPREKNLASQVEATDASGEFFPGTQTALPPSTHLMLPRHPHQAHPLR